MAGPVRETAAKAQAAHAPVHGQAPVAKTTKPQSAAVPMALADPSKLSVDHVTALQGSCGNRATSALLAVHRHEHGHRAQTHRMPRRLPVQRFPATALSSPVQWSTLTGGVSRPGEGISGGVYILTSNQTKPDLDKVVVKPVFGTTGIGEETPEQLQFGDRALSSLLGVATPVSRIVQARTREFADLVALLRPHQPPIPTTFNRDEGITWKDLSAAHGFVVMSKVPDAKSTVSMAKEAATDEQTRNDLLRVVFGKPFLGQLARICVGDLLLGNADRLVFGAANLGNIMISMSQKGDPTVFAIDTTALLPKAAETAKIVDSGSTYGGASSATKVTMANPEERLEGFYRMLVSHMKSGDKGGHAEGAAPWQLFESAYKENKDRIDLEFLFAWRRALLDVKALVESREGREKMKGLTKEYQGSRGEQMLGYGALKSNAMYLASRTTKFDTHEESTADPAAYYAYTKLAAINTNDFLPPSDALSPAVDVSMPGVLRKEKGTVPVPRELPVDLIRFLLTGSKELPPHDRVTLVGEKTARYEGGLAALGTKKRGLIKRHEVERNRVAIGKYLINVFRLAAGEGRLRHHMWRVQQAAKDVMAALGGNLKRTQVGKVVPSVVRALVPAFDKLTADGTAYGPKIDQAKGDLSSLKGELSVTVAYLFERSGTMLETELRNTKQAVKTDEKDVLVDAIRDYVNS